MPVEVVSPRRRQLSALGAILLGLGAWVAAAALFWNAWARLLVAVVSLIVATWSAWYVLSRRGVVRVVAAVVLAGALLGALLAVVLEHTLWRIAPVVVLGLGSSALARVALGTDRSQLRTQVPPGVRMGAASRPGADREPEVGGREGERVVPGRGPGARHRDGRARPRR